MSDKPEKIYHVLQSNKIRLSAPCPTAKGKFSTLGWDIYMNNPRFVLDVKDPSLASPEYNFGRVQGAMEPATFYAFLEQLDTAIKSTEEWKTKLELFGNAKGQPGEVVALSDLWVGKDKEGCVYLSLISKKDGFPTIKFIFSAPDHRFTKHKDMTGMDLNKADTSVLYAKAYLRMLTVMMGAVLVKDYVKPLPFVPGNKPNGNNYPPKATPKAAPENNY
jgi:hypothetical protein